MDNDRSAFMGLGANIRSLREARGWSLKKIGDDLGVSAQSVSAWERGINAPEAERMARLASLFGVTMDGLMGRTVPVPIAQPQGPQTTVERDLAQQAIGVALEVLRPDLPPDKLHALAAVFLSLALRPPDPANQTPVKDQLRLTFQGAFAARFETE